MSRSGCPPRVLRKVFKAWEELYEEDAVRAYPWVNNDDFIQVINRAEDKFGLTERDQWHELFWNDCKRLLADEITKTSDTRGRGW